MAKMTQFEKGKTVVFGPEGFARVEGIGEKVVLGNKVTRKLNDGQRTLMEKVRKAYARELAAALKLDDEATDARIDAAIEKRIAAK